jgi:two-component system C4-dicarboxylate transport sensor histidine kinase DctB
MTFNNKLAGKRYQVIVVTMALIFVICAKLYRDFVHQSTLQGLQSNTAIIVHSQAKALESELQKFSLLPLAFSENPHVHAALLTPTLGRIKRLNEKLSFLSTRTGTPYIYVVDHLGNTIAASNYDKEDSFVGRRYEFRPYFKLAMERGSSEYFAKGERTGKAGLFLARRIDENKRHLGVIVVKVEFEEITSLWEDPTSTTLVTDSDHIVLFSSDQSLNYSTLQPLPDARRSEIRKTKQFDLEPLDIASLKIDSNLMGLDSQKRRILAAKQEIADLKWLVYRTVQISPELKAADIQVKLRVLSAGVLIIGLGLFIAWRVSRENQRTQLTKLLKTEVARKTKELSNTNNQLELEIKEREQINNRFRNAREELAQANRLGSIGAITASVAHELNQPVAAIQAFAENATKFLTKREPARAKENLVSIVELTSKIGTITNELRRYSRRGSQSIDRISIADVIDGVELLIGDRIRVADVNFKVIATGSPLPHVKAGPVRLEQVLVNLLQNAIEALEGTPSARIEMQIIDEKTHVYITISDNGPGISDNIKSKVFTPFFTQKPHGLGIGLGIVKDIMNDFGGTIEVTRPLLGGATFKLQLQKL